ncbi:glycogen debranching protein GlgX [Pseudaeromonas paramecii]|uniref:Glycogen debranching protein GlgX n=1 Tax=Pseudaeromonas paramecii TaxID=2138166 RepID=A0ABP8PX90_9GAMM
MKCSRGHCNQLGATLDNNGVNFALWARLASEVELLLFKHADDANPVVIPLNPRINRTAYYWHIHVAEIGDGQIYGWRINGPWRPYEGTCFDPEKVLLDPYGREVVLGHQYDRWAASRPGSNTAQCAKSVVVSLEDYDWEDDEAPEHPLSRSIIYELHVGGFTRDASAGVAPSHRGTYAGVVDKIPYLKELGITAVELLPVFQFDPQDAPHGLDNYWGYSPLSFFAPHTGYASHSGRKAAINEFRDMVKALHKAGIEVILDVVYNHTAEGDDNGPLICFRGIDHEAYYILDPLHRRSTNYSGCGNTLNGSHPVTKRLIIDSLRYWREHLHVDGFRFDLASILSRDEAGNPQVNPPTLLAIDTDPVLANCKLIAEAWDAGGLYQVGSLAGSRWREWNGQFRDDVRRFVKGENNTVRNFAHRISGSPDIYQYNHADPEKSINFVTCHDGFTLWDLVSYNQKHNLANGEHNRDGQNDNYSWNHGAEGPTQDPSLNGLRLRQCKNLLTCTLLSIGTPMLLMGDEVLRTQQGNNNAYCQNNPISWMNWEWGPLSFDMLRYTTELIRYRRFLFHHDRQDALPVSLAEILHRAEICWHGVQAHSPDWGEHSHALAFSAISLEHKMAIYVIFNAYWEPLLFNLPLPPMGIEGHWQRIIDTAQPSPMDIIPMGDPLPLQAKSYRADARSLCLFVCGQLPFEA